MVMQYPEHYEQDVLFFFDGRPRELALYQHLETQMEASFPDVSVKVQKSQISFYGRHLFAAASVPLRRKKAWPEQCLLVTFGLGYHQLSSRIAAVSEPYPGRWTHHVALSREEQVDGELMGWLREAHEFSQSKR